MNPEILANLRNVLADLYQDEASLRRIIADSGIGLERIDLSSTMINDWHSVLTEAEKIGRVDALLKVVEREYGMSKGFRKACDTYRRSTSQSKQAPNPVRLQILSDLRRAVEPKVTQGEMAAFFGLKDQRTVGAWERGQAIPYTKHREHFIVYLWDKLRLRDNLKKFEEVWDILSNEWEWDPLSGVEREEFNISDLPIPSKPSSPPETTDFIGRSAELKHYQQMLGADGFVIIAGSPGVGKSALAARLTMQMDATERTFWLQCSSGDGIETVIWKLAGWLYLKRGNRTIWHLLHKSPQQPRELLDNLFEQLHGADLLICLDDFHLLDNAKPLLKKLLAAARVKAIQVIFTARQLSDLAWMLEIQPLGGLNREDCQQLIQKRGFTFEQTIMDELHQCVAGNPQLLLLALDAFQSKTNIDHLIKRLFEAGKVEKFLLEEVYDHLSEEERQTMSGVAIFDGDPATADAIEAVLDDPDYIRPTLIELNRRYLLQIIEGEFARSYLQHRIIQEFYYGRLGNRQRREMHRQAGNYYETTQNFFRAGLHYAYAGEDLRAVIYATKDVRSRLIQGESMRLQLILERLNTSRLPMMEQAQVALAKGQLYIYTQRSQLARQNLEEAYKLLLAVDNLAATRTLQIQNCRELGFLLKDSLPTEAVSWLQRGLVLIEHDPEREADLSIQLADAYSKLGDSVAVQQTLEQARTLLPKEVGWLQLLVLIGLGKHYYLQNDLKTSYAYMQDALNMAETQNDPFNMIAIRNNLAALSQITGAWPEAVEHYRQAQELVIQYGYLREGARIDLNSGVLYGQMGDNKQALVNLSRALGFAKTAELHDDRISSLSYLADLALEEGDYPTANDRLSEAEQLLEQSKQNYLRPFLTYLRAKYWLLQKQHTPALAMANQALEIAKQLGMGQEEGLALRVRGEVYAALDDMTSAEMDFNASLASLDGNPYEIAWTKMAWGAQLMTIQPQTAQRLLQEANSTFQQLGARSCVEKIKKILTS